MKKEYVNALGNWVTGIGLGMAIGSAMPQSDKTISKIAVGVVLTGIMINVYAMTINPEPQTAK